MAALPFNNTDILYLDYYTCGHGHQMQCRFDGGEPNVGDAMTELDAFLDALGNSHRSMTVQGARVQLQGTNVSFPVVWTGGASYGTGDGFENESAQFYDFVGRSRGGRRVRLALFGAITNFYQNKYRAPEGADLAFAQALAVLQSAEGTFLAVDGLQPRWQSYVNLGDNAYWRNHIR